MSNLSLADSLLQESASRKTRFSKKVLVSLFLGLGCTGLLGGVLYTHCMGESPITMFMQPAKVQPVSQPAMAANKVLPKLMSLGKSAATIGNMHRDYRPSQDFMRNTATNAKTSDWLTNTKPVYRTGKDAGVAQIAQMTSCSDCVLAEYVWLDIDQKPRSKTMTMTAIPRSVDDLRTWNYDGSSTGQADGGNSEVSLKPIAIFKDPFRGYPHVLVLAEAINAVSGKPQIGNTRAEAVEVLNKYKKHDPWFGMEQEYTFMMPGKVGEEPTVPYGFNKDGSEPAPQGPYYCGVGNMKCIGREIMDDHYMKCLEAGVKISGVNIEVMPGQAEYQVGPCRGIEMGDHLTMARYLMLRVSEYHGVIVSIEPKPAEGDWNGAGCHTNFSTEGMRKDGGYAEIEKVCNAFGEVAAEHIAEYGEDNDKRLTGGYETCSINEFKWGVADRGASIRIPRDAEKDGKGYMEDRRPGANCDPYRVIKKMMQTTGEALEK